MAQVKIKDLNARSDFDETCEVPLDDAIQTFKATGLQMFDFFQGRPFLGFFRNVGLSVSASAGAMTVALTQSNGDALDTDVNKKAEVFFRDNTEDSGILNRVEFDAPLSLVIPSGATMGFINSDNAKVYVYAYYDGTNKGLMVSSQRLDTKYLYILTAIDTSADDNSYYADAARSNAAIVLLGHFRVDGISTAGTWTTPSNVTVTENPVPTSQTTFSAIKREVFTASGTYYKKPDCKYLRVTVVGGGGGSGGTAATSTSEAAVAGGGGGGGACITSFANGLINATETVTVGAGGTAGSSGNNDGGAGGTSSFSAHCSATGGGGGKGSPATTGESAVAGGDGGTGSGGDLNFKGSDGGVGQVRDGGRVFCNNGGSSHLGGAAQGASAGTAGKNYGGGAGGPGSNPSTSAKAGAAGAGGVVIIDEFYV